MNNEFHSHPVVVDTETKGDTFIVNYKGFDSIIIRPLELERDLPVLFEWFNMEYAKLWGMQGVAFDKVQEIYQRVEADDSDNAYIGELASTQKRLFLFHYYDPKKHTIGKFFNALSSDRGTHRIFSPLEEKIPNLTWYVFRAISEFCFRNQDINRIIDEPNIYNHKYFAACKQAGYYFGKVIHLPDKTAQLTILTRERFEQLRLQPPLIKPKLKFRPIWLWFRMVFVRITNKIKKIFNQ